MKVESDSQPRQDIHQAHQREFSYYTTKQRQDATLSVDTEGFSLTTTTHGALHFTNAAPEASVYLSNVPLQRLRRLAKGFSYTQIAAAENMRPATIRSSFAKTIFPALGVNNQADAVNKGIEIGFIKDNSSDQQK